MSDVADRLDSIRERVEAATEAWEALKQAENHNWAPHVEYAEKLLEESRSDVPWLLSLVDYLREELCLRTCNCGPTDPNPEKHAGYCNYVEALEEIYAALRDAAQEGAE